MLGQEAYTTQKIASLLGVNSISTVTRRASRESWQSATRTGRGGGKLWIVASMPKETRELIASGLLRKQYATHEADSCAIAGTIYSAMLGTAPAPVQPINYTPAPSATPLFPGASDRERAVATARLAFVREIERMSGILGKEGAIRHLADSSRLGSLPSILMEQISTATACKRGGVLTRRTLYRWMADYAERGEAGLLPSQSKTVPIPSWFDDFLRHYQKPQHPSIALGVA
ncbi:DNA-binding protein [Desulfovibrio sp.]|uniref:DNA-binding protein n=1 Tax=Desulfovibrio sp. TaxID=885 RepID=UPI0025BD3008|nr:DNA-binding protein [Desulfovibrio sp.]